jgi:hypothetical protein
VQEDTNVFSPKHVRRSWLILHYHSCARLVSGSVIITEIHDPALGEGPVCSLVPTAGNRAWDTWWRFTPRFFTQFLEVLGFTRHQVTFHRQLADKTPLNMFTVVSSRPDA